MFEMIMTTEERRAWALKPAAERLAENPRLGNEKKLPRQRCAVINGRFLLPGGVPAQGTKNHGVG